MDEYLISHYNGYRDENQLVIYTDGETTKTNKFGYEVCVSQGRAIACGGNDNAIPKGGMVVSGHGKAAVFLSERVLVGTKVTVKDNLIVFETDSQAQAIFVNEKISEIKRRREFLDNNRIDYCKDTVNKLLQQALLAAADQRFEEAAGLADEAYLHTCRTKSDEVRAVWHRPMEKNMEQVEARVKSLSQAGFNNILIETNYGGHANALRCVKELLPPMPRLEGFDVIEAFIVQCKRYGIKVHCWYEAFFCGHGAIPCPILQQKPHWLAQRRDGGYLLDGYDDFYFLNPVLPQVRQYLLDSVKELLDKYDFDGFQLDYIRYPDIRDIDHAAGFDATTKKLFLEETGIDIDKLSTTQCPQWERFNLWCCQWVTKAVAEVRELIEQYRKNGRYVELSTAVVGDPAEAVRNKCQDWLYWVKQGWLDSIYPMAYYNHPSEIEKEVRFMVENYGEADNIAGIAPLFNGLSSLDAVKQVEAVRKAGAKGVAFFAAGNFKPDSLEALKISVFR